MPRSLSSSALAAMLAERTGEVICHLLTIEHAELAAPLRYTDNRAALVRGGDTYLPAVFDITLPDDTDQFPPRAKLTIDNVDRQIVQVLRALTTSPTVTIEVIRAAALDTPEERVPGLTLESVTFDASQLTATLTIADLSREPYPAGTFDKRWTGLHS